MGFFAYAKYRFFALKRKQISSKSKKIVVKYEKRRINTKQKKKFDSTETSEQWRIEKKLNQQKWNGKRDARL